MSSDHEAQGEPADVASRDRRSRRVINGAAGLASARWEELSRMSAGNVRDVIRHTRRSGVDVRAAAKQISSSRLTDGGSGAFGQAAGHLFERLDVASYNARNGASGKVLQLAKDPSHGVYDAVRKINGRAAGSVQHKLSRRHVGKAIQKMESRSPGSAARGTIRVPKGELERARQAAARRTRVAASSVSKGRVNRTLKRGVSRLSSLGPEAATSVPRAMGRAAGFAAATGVATGAMTDARRLRSGALSPREFWERRAQDAVDAGASGAVALGATAVLGATSAGPIVVAAVSGGAAVAAGTGLRVAVRKGLQRVAATPTGEAE